MRHAILHSEVFPARMRPSEALSSRPRFYRAAGFGYNPPMIDRIRASRYAFLHVATLALALLVASGDARAQNFFSDFFGGLFGGGAPHHAYPRPAPAYRPHREYYPERRANPPGEGRSHAWRAPKPSRRNAAKEGPRQTDTIPSEANFFVAVLGDVLSQNLADGLEESFEDTPEIGVLNKGKESSGLVRKDYYDWAKTAHDIASGPQKIDVAVAMVGSNDRQPIIEGSQSPEPLSPRWRELYAARVDSVIQAFKEKNIPLIWVGLPVMKGEKFSADMAQINEIQRARATAAGIVFVDLWDKFAGDHGQYSAFGPDIIGQSVKLRSDDGVHFTGAGARKLALFVEGEIKRLFDARQNPKPAGESKPAKPPAPGEPAPSVTFRSPLGEPPPAAPTLPQDRPAIGPAQPLAGPPAALASDELARRDKPRGQAKPDSPERAVAEHVFMEGGSVPHRPGRADDLAWPAEKSGQSPPK
jgi:uncharacterized protein